MIPQFPEFKKLKLTDKDEIARFTREHPPYSDYNFTSLWTYNTEDSVEVCWLNDNLVLLFIGYIDGERFLTFLGTNRVEEVAHKLLSYARTNGLPEELRLIPETTIKKLEKKINLLMVSEDIDNHDYILSVEKMMTFSGNKLAPKRNFVNRFVSNHGERAEVCNLDLNDKSVQQSVLNLFELWATQTDQGSQEISNERTALKRLLRDIDHLDAHGIGIYIDESLAAFSIDEIMHDGYGVIHYEKANKDFVGIFPYLKQQSAKKMADLGAQYINYEQDMGSLGLRKAKLSYRPVHHLKKYKIFLRPN